MRLDKQENTAIFYGLHLFDSGEEMEKFIKGSNYYKSDLIADAIHKRVIVRDDVIMCESQKARKYFIYQASLAKFEAILSFFLYKQTKYVTREELKSEYFACLTSDVLGQITRFVHGMLLEQKKRERETYYCLSGGDKIDMETGKIKDSDIKMFVRDMFIITGLSKNKVTQAAVGKEVAAYNKSMCVDINKSDVFSYLKENEKIRRTRCRGTHTYSGISKLDDDDDDTSDEESAEEAIDFDELDDFFRKPEPTQDNPQASDDEE